MCCKKPVEFSLTEPWQEVRAAVAQRAEVAAVHAAVELHAAILEVIQGQVAAAAAAEARPQSTNTGSTLETSEAV